MKENKFFMKLKEFEDEEEIMTNVDGFMENIPQFLGKIDADKEWKDNPEEAYKKFLHTKSYSEFIDPDALILLGRTGTGKTSILRCLCENINRKRIKEYDSAIIVPFDEILYNLLDAIDDFNGPNINTLLVRCMSMYINCFVMKSLVKSQNFDTSSSAMYKYLMRNNLGDLGDYDDVQNGISKIKELLKNTKKLKRHSTEFVENSIFIADIIEAFSSNEYEKAYSEMLVEIRNRKILVLIDTLNEYDLRDIKLVLCVKALIATTFSFYNNVSNNHIYVKISIPSEIHTQLIERLPGKQQGNTVVIQWKNNDLIKMIAIRLLFWCESEPNDFFRLKRKYKYSDFYDDNVNSANNAKNLLYEFLPSNCPTSLNYTFDTLSYCIRHTLKKPRELMLIFNSFIEKIRIENNINYFYNHPKEIRNIIHSTQETMISGALSMYTSSYIDILRACETVLQDRKYYFQGKELDDKLKEAAANRQGYDLEDIKRILLESGLVGKINDISYQYVLDNIPKNTPHSIKNSIRIIKARFEYQVKGRLSLNRNDVYVIHPMCYEHFECSVGMQTLVYPNEFGDDSEIMKSVKLKEWD